MKMLQSHDLSHFFNDNYNGILTAPYSLPFYIHRLLSDLLLMWNMRRVPVLEQGNIRVVRVISEKEDDLIPEHAHDEDEIAYVLSGELRIHIDGIGDLNLIEGNAVLIPKGTRHWGILSNDCELVVVYHP
ncbi:MAG: hypothetical protein C0200_04710 [Thermoproteota archaeon]|nr:MAG: hypothetical protein C0200_04710 [Candidatus Korarchaeota archaeon]